MPVLKDITRALHRLDLKGDNTILVALSGGPDSVALLHALCQIRNQFKIKPVAAHLNHEWRPEAQLDAEFCEELCQKLNVAFTLEKLSELKFNVPWNGSREAQSRQIRQLFLNQVAQRNNASYIALGHHLDDQIETFFMRLIRGSSSNGLTGMKQLQKQYWRPLLEVSKAEIYNYLAEHQLNFCIDSTNESDLFLRNRIRKILPILLEIDPRFKLNCHRTLSKLSATNNFVERLLATELPLVLFDGKLNLNALWQRDPYLQNELVIRWLYQKKVPFTLSEALISEIMRFLKFGKNGTHKVNPAWYLSKNHDLIDILHAKDTISSDNTN